MLILPPIHGMALVYLQYMKDETLLQDEQKAREAKRGVWSLPITEQVPPWKWSVVNSNRSPRLPVPNPN
jgi:endonuclease YncB( thermonuclease family)